MGTRETVSYFLKHHQIFDLKIEGNEVIFSTKYRCAEGFLDDYRWNL